MHKAGELIPFDISTFLSMEYSIQQHSDMVAAGANLKTHIDNVLAPDHQMENPVTQAQGRANFEVTASAPDKLLLAQLEALTARVNGIERRSHAGVFLRSAAAKPSIAGSASAERFYGGERALPLLELTFSVREGTSPATLSKFMEENVLHFASSSVVIEQATDGESYTVHYEPGAIETDLMDIWEKEADSKGIVLIPF